MSAPLQHKSPQAIEADIARTRERIGQDIDELSYKLSPERLREHARTTLHDAQEVVMTTFQEVTHNVSETAKEQASGLFDLIRDNPLPAALIGLGVGLLAAGSATAASSSGPTRSQDGYSRGTSRYVSGYTDSGPSEETSSSYDSLSGKALPKPNYARGYYSESANQGTSTTPSRARQAKRGLGRLIEDQPLAVGAVALIAGAAVGLSIPGSRLEDEVMGSTRDHFVDEAVGTAVGAVSVAQETVAKAGEAVKEEWRERAKSPEQLRQDAKASVESGVSDLRSELKDAAKNVVDKAKESAKAEAEKQGLKNPAS